MFADGLMERNVVMVGAPGRFRVVVVGAGQAGLAVSYELAARGIEHVVLERARVGQMWRGLWDSFCLVTPNWTMSLPGAAYTGDDPEGFVPRDEIVRYLQRYASSFGAPVREGVGVDSLEPGPNGGFLLRTSAGELRADELRANFLFRGVAARGPDRARRLRPRKARGHRW